MRRMNLVAAVLPLALSLSAVPAMAETAPAAPPAVATVRNGDVLAAVRAVRESDPAQALKLGEPAWAAAADKNGVIELGLELGEAAMALRDKPKAAEIGAALRSQATLTPAQQVRLLKSLAGAIHVFNDAARIAELEDDLIRLERGLGPDGAAFAEIWRQVAASYFLMQDADNALRAARIALSKVRKHPDMVEYNANQIVFSVAAQQGRMPEAIAALREVERVGRALDKPADPGLLHNAAGLFNYLADWPKAIDYGQRALAAWDAKPRPGLSRAAVLNNLGSAYVGAGELARAAAIYRDALAGARANGEPVGTSLNNLADVMQQTGRPREALPLLAEAAAEFERDGAIPEAAIVYSNMGASQADLGQHRAAADSFARSLALFKRSDNVPRRLELYPRMVDTLDALGRHREALVLMREFKAANDEFVNVESKTRIAKLESAVELARKEGQLAESERDRAAKQARLTALQADSQRQRLLRYGLIAALLLLGALALVKIRESRFRKRTNLELERKNAETLSQHRELEQLNATIRRQGEEDALTGLHNRRYAQDWCARLAATQAEARANGQRIEPVLAMLLDIDHFKRINDVHGHEAGDHALLHFSDVLRGCARGSDLLVRWGGEEFLWVCPNTSPSEAAALFERVREQLRAQPLVRASGTVALTVSAGVSLFPLWPGRPGDWSLSLRVADAALYRAKREGRDRWVGLGPGRAAATDACQPEASIESLEEQGCLVRLGDARSTTSAGGQDHAVAG
ncbi:MAG TPA: tetratricopeptide repeat-containing diguanylate cyclase [Lysobacter sp.]